MPDLLPNADQARIDSRKLRDYALNPEHITGRFKAAFFSKDHAALHAKSRRSGSYGRAKIEPIS